MRDTAAIEEVLPGVRVFGQRSRPKGARRGKQEGRAHQRCRLLRRFRVLSLAMMVMCGTAAWRFGRVAQADDWSTHRRSLPREIFKLASTWLIPWCDVLESGCDSRVGRPGEVQNPAQDAQLSWCSKLGHYQALASTESQVLDRTPSGATATTTTIGTNTDTEGCRHCSGKMGPGCRGQLSRKLGGPARAEVDVPAQWTLCPFTAEQDAILVRPGLRVA